MTMHEISLLGGEFSLEHEERTVLKFPLQFGETVFPLPDGGIPIHVGVQGEQLMVWVELPTGDVESSDRHFQVYGTGWAQRTDVCHNFLGTIMDGDMVWHVYETHKHTQDEVDAISAVKDMIGDWL